MKKSRLPGLFFSFVILFVVTSTNAATWTTINGRVLTQTGTPVCAMVLANGQHIFSCGGIGNFSLKVPLDSKNLITLQVFASGFSPFKRSLTAGQAIGYNVFMDRDISGRAFRITHNEFASSRTGWVLVSGNIDSNGTPLCAMILINGQSMFSCNQNFGRYNLEVPLDSTGNVTLQAFVAGFQPSRKEYASGTNIDRLNLLLGSWAFSYSIGSTFTDRYALNEIQNISGDNVILGKNEFGNVVIAARSETLVPGSSSLIGEFSLYDGGTLFDQVFMFDIVGPNMVSGTLIWLDSVTGDIDCFTCPWDFIGTRSRLTTLSTQMVQPMSVDHLFHEQAALSADTATRKEGDQPTIDRDMVKQIYKGLSKFSKTD